MTDTGAVGFCFVDLPRANIYVIGSSDSMFPKINE